VPDCLHPLKEHLPVRLPPVFAILVLCLLALQLRGCDYGTRNEDYAALPGTQNNQFANQLAKPGPANAPKAQAKEAGINAQGQRQLLESMIQLIESAATTPGGDNFAIAVDYLNKYFGGFDSAQFFLSDEIREYLMPLIKKKGVDDLESRTFVKSDGRHLEDCLMYHMVATRVAGAEGDDLERVRAIFRWLVEQIQLVPAGSLGPPPLAQGADRLPQAQARPYDVLLRGMATEEGGGWSERAWLFMSLCRQIGIDVGLLAYQPAGKNALPRPWCCAAIVKGKPYLFDTRIGVEIPGPDGEGIATYEEATTNPEVLGRLDLPGQSPYVPISSDLAAGKVTVLMDSTPGYLSARMRLLQNELAGKNRMMLYRDPVAQRDNFAQAFGERFGSAVLWALPLEVQYRLFNDPQFVTATLYPLQIFDAKFPLLTARLDQLRGRFDSAKDKYVRFRKAEQVILNDPKKSQAPPELRHALDMYATYFLALCHLDQHRSDQAEVMFNLALKELPEPTGSGPPYELFRWGVESNLARFYEEKGDRRRAIAYYCAPKPTLQYHGDLLRARSLVWCDPMSDPPEPLPAAPPPRTFGGPVAPKAAP
jgi:hypothetical protein